MIIVFHDQEKVTKIVEITNNAIIYTNQIHFTTNTLNSLNWPDGHSQLKMFITPPQKQRFTFDKAILQNEILLEKFGPLDASLTALNANGEASGDYTPCITFLENLTPANNEEAELKALLLSFYPNYNVS